MAGSLARLKLIALFKTFKTFKTFSEVQVKKCATRSDSGVLNALNHWNNLNATSASEEMNARRRRSISSGVRSAVSREGILGRPVAARCFRRRLRQIRGSRGDH